MTVVGTNGEIIRTTRFTHEHVDYSWVLLSSLAVALIAAGLRKLFWPRNSN